MKSKTWVLVLLLLVSLCVVSCKEDKSEFSPRIISSFFLLNNQDTLLLKYDSIATVYVLDTIHINDTVNHAIACATYANTLLSVVLTQDGESVKTEVLYDDQILSAVSSSAEEVQNGNLVFNPYYNGVSFPVRMSALKSGRTDITWTVSSDSKYSPSMLKFRVVVKE